MEPKKEREKCTFEQAQAIKFLRKLGSKLRAHYYFHTNSPQQAEEKKEQNRIAFSFKVQEVNPFEVTESSIIKRGVESENELEDCLTPIKRLIENSPGLKSSEQEFLIARMKFQEG